MDEYISREEAVKRIKSCISTSHDAWESGYNTAMAEIMEQIKHMPTADVQPVKHGRWEVNGDRFYPFCSNCKYEPPKELIRCNALSLEPILTKYCPNCGSENGTRIYRGGDGDE